MADNPIKFYAHAQSTAVPTFLPLLHPHFPHSNPLYNRIQAPHNLPSRHCLFAATFPPNSPTVPETYTIIFADRSRHSESQIWLFNPLISNPISTGLSPLQQETLTAHVTAIVLFLRDVQIPDAPGWPFSPILRFACVHEYITASILRIAQPRDALARISYWNLWNISTAALAAASSTTDEKQRRGKRPLPEGFTVGRVPEEQLDIVLSTSTIERQPTTMLMLPNVGILDAQGTLAAWGYIGIDGSFATLYVLPAYRGRGLASCVAVELLGRLGRGDFRDLGYHGRSGWVHADVHEGNRESEGVMRSLGGEVGWVTSYVWVDSAKF